LFLLPLLSLASPTSISRFSIIFLLLLIWSFASCISFIYFSQVFSCFLHGLQLLFPSPSVASSISLCWF
jgi:hypothetical protein